MEFWIFLVPLRKGPVMNDLALESLVQAINPQFQAAILGLPMSEVASQGPPTAAVARLAGSALGAGLIEQLAGPVLKVAAGLILQEVRREAQIILDAEKAAHPGLNLTLIQQFINSLGTTTVKAGG